MQNLKRAALMACAILAAGSVQATPGAVDEKGCHNSDKIGYHCHAKKVRDVRLPNERPSPKVEAAQRLREQCKRSPDDSPCKDRAKK